MKNENKIVEILAESLKRQDKLVEEFREMRGGIQGVRSDIQEMRGDIQEMRNDTQEMRGDIQELKGNVNRMVIAVDALADVVKIAMDGIKDMNNIKQRIARLERHTGLE